MKALTMRKIRRLRTIKNNQETRDSLWQHWKKIRREPARADSVGRWNPSARSGRAKRDTKSNTEFNKLT